MIIPISEKAAYNLNFPVKLFAIIKISYLILPPTDRNPNFLSINWANYNEITKAFVLYHNHSMLCDYNLLKLFLSPIPYTIAGRIITKFRSGMFWRWFSTNNLCLASLVHGEHLQSSLQGFCKNKQKHWIKITSLQDTIKKMLLCLMSIHALKGWVGRKGFFWSTTWV